MPLVNETSNFDKTYVMSEYLWKFFDPGKMRNIISDMKNMIVESEVEFDAIACRGVSGLLIASPLCVAMNRPLIIVRKGISGTHSSARVEGYLPSELRYVIVDDFIETGTTVYTIIRRIREQYKNSKPHRMSARCVGLFLCEASYHYDDYNDLSYGNFFRKHIHGPMIGLE